MVYNYHILFLGPPIWEMKITGGCSATGFARSRHEPWQGQETNRFSLGGRAKMGNDVIAGLVDLVHEDPFQELHLHFTCRCLYNQPE